LLKFSIKIQIVYFWIALEKIMLVNIYWRENYQNLCKKLIFNNYQIVYGNWRTLAYKEFARIIINS